MAKVKYYDNDSLSYKKIEIKRRKKSKMYWPSY